MAAAQQAGYEKALVSRLTIKPGKVIVNYSSLSLHVSEKQ